MLGDWEEGLSQEFAHADGAAMERVFLVEAALLFPIDPKPMYGDGQHRAENREQKIESGTVDARIAG